MNKMWIYVIIFLILIVVLVIFLKCSNIIRLEKPPVKRHDLNIPKSLYVQIEDEDGNKSVIHDVGKREDHSQNISFAILKNEIHDGEEKILSMPKKVWVGDFPDSLKEVEFSTDESQKYYTVMTN
jgi:hypothetical protein